MILTTLQPDEWLEGYRGRLSRLNDIPLRTGLEPALRSVMVHDRCDADEPLSFISMLSLALGLPSADIVLRHTLWPAQVTMERSLGKKRIERHAAISDNRSVFSRAMRARPWLCPRCVDDDLNRLHYSYWHRSHQLAGQFFCRQHGQVLQFVPASKHLVSLPHEHAGASMQPAADFLETVRRSVHVTCAVHISNAILEGQLITSRKHCTAVLSQRAETFGITADAKGQFPEAKKLVDRHIPAAWLQDAMPRMTVGLQSKAFVDKVFDSSLLGLSGMAFAVIAALLYDDANEALAALSAQASSSKRSKGPQAVAS